MCERVNYHLLHGDEDFFKHRQPLLHLRPQAVLQHLNRCCHVLQHVAAIPVCVEG